MVKKGQCPVSFLWRASKIAQVFKVSGLLLMGLCLVIKGFFMPSVTRIFFLGVILWTTGWLLNAKKPE